MADSPSSSPLPPDPTSTIGYARDAIDARSDQLQKQAAALEIDAITDHRSLREFGDAVYSLLTATDVFGPWMVGRTLSTVQSRLDKACRWSVGLLELRTMDSVLNSDASLQIECIDLIRKRIERQLQRGKAKLSLATKELARPRFREDVTELTAELRWSGNGNEPGVEGISVEVISGVKNEFVLTANEGVPHFTTLHLLLLQLRRLRSVMDLFQGQLDRDTSERIQQSLTRLYDELEPAALSSTVMILVTRMMGNSTNDDEARALREFVPVATVQVDQLFDRLQSVWSQSLIGGLEDDFSNLLSHYNESTSRNRAPDLR